MSSSERIPCDQVISRLWEYVDGELEAEREARVERHLDACARCFPEYDFRRAYRKFLVRVGPQEVPPEVRGRIFLAILEEERSAAPAGARGEGLGGWLRRLLRRG